MSPERRGRGHQPEPAPSPLEQDAEVKAAEAAKAEAEAEFATAAAQRALEQAEDEGERNARRCPHCRERLAQHPADDPLKGGAWHCDGCGCCWAPGIRELRAGTPACAPSTAGG